MHTGPDRRRARRCLEPRELAALVVAKPESFAYLTGAEPGPAALFRRAGAALAVLPADPGIAMAAIVPDLSAASIARASTIQDLRTHATWVETADLRPFATDAGTAAELVARAHASTGRPTGFARPETFSPEVAFGLLREVLAERGLLRARIGLDLDFWPVADFALLQAMLPEAELVDGSLALAELKAVKSPAEIEALTLAAELAEAGVVAATAAVRAGMLRADLAAAWRQGVAVEAERRGVTGRLTGQWEYVSIGPDPWGPPAPLRSGDIVKFDVGCIVAGNNSDGARTFVFGRPDPRAVEVHAALLEGFMAGLEVLRPGRTMGEVHAAATAAIRRAGFGTFSRGHFGHGLGRDTFGEVWPFIAAGSEVVIEPGMVLAFEAPFYVDGLGGFIVEDQLVVGEDAVTPAWRLPRGLVSLG